MSAGNETHALVERVLGPAGPELECDACFEHIDEFVEVEVAGGDAEAAVPGMTAHLHGCPACREEHESLRDLVRAERPGAGQSAGGGVTRR